MYSLLSDILKNYEHNFARYMIRFVNKGNEEKLN